MLPQAITTFGTYDDPAVLNSFALLFNIQQKEQVVYCWLSGRTLLL
jgi:hypothetical protein